MWALWLCLCILVIWEPFTFLSNKGLPPKKNKKFLALLLGPQSSGAGPRKWDPEAAEVEPKLARGSD